MSNLVPEVRVNKNGVAVTKHVLPQGAAKNGKALPAPAAATGVYQPLPALKGKVLKEAKEILRMAPNGSQDYEDRITGAFLGNDIRAMRILHGLTNGGEYSNVDTAINIIDTRTRLGLGDYESPEEYIDKCNKYIEMADGSGPLSSDDFLPSHIMGEEGGKVMVWLESNWDDVDDIIEFFNGREMEEYSANEYETIWKAAKDFAVKPLRDGFI